MVQCVKYVSGKCAFSLFNLSMRPYIMVKYWHYCVINRTIWCHLLGVVTWRKVNDSEEWHCPNKQNMFNESYLLLFCFDEVNSCWWFLVIILFCLTCILTVTWFDHHQAKSWVNESVQIITKCNGTGMAFITTQIYCSSTCMVSP